MKLTIDYPDDMTDTKALTIAWQICNESGGLRWMKPNERYWQAENTHGIWIKRNTGQRVTLSIAPFTEEFKNEHNLE